MYLNIGHVAYVEDVVIDDGKTFITWVEENASGNCEWSGSEQISVDGAPVLRWRITREYNNNFIEKYGTKLIHLNY